MAKIIDSAKLDNISIEYRRGILEIIKFARRGHIGSAFSIMEIIRVLYDDVLCVKPDNPFWEDRDRFILSKGHGCLALYVVLAAKQFFPKKELYTFCESESILGGHPDYGKVPGIEASTGSLGHGLSVGVGIALGGKIDKKNYRTFILLGDGECNEGSVWEAAMTISKHKLNRLFVIVDYNKMQCYSKTSEVLELEPFGDKWRSFGFVVLEVDGHDVEALRKVFRKATQNYDEPKVIICHTTKGKGVSLLENDPSWHHKSRIPDELMQKLFAELKLLS
jgi:transketolase